MNGLKDVDKDKNSKSESDTDKNQNPPDTQEPPEKDVDLWDTLIVTPPKELIEKNRRYYPNDERNSDMIIFMNFSFIFFAFKWSFFVNQAPQEVRSSPYLEDDEVEDDVDHEEKQAEDNEEFNENDHGNNDEEANQQESNDDEAPSKIISTSNLNKLTQEY